ncbi:uncharacterized protein LOC144654329 [Oculina patagonica]
MYDKTNIDKVAQAIWIGIVVANFLLRTNRGLKTIELCNECLILLNNKAVIKEQEVIQTYSEQLYWIVYKAFYTIHDYTSAIKYGRILLVMYHESSDKSIESKLSLELAALYHHKSEYDEAKQLSEHALAINTEIGDRDGEASSYERLGTVFQSLGEHIKAKEYLEKALWIRKEIGDKEGEGRDYEILGTVLVSLGEYIRAKEYFEKVLILRIKTGDLIGEASCYGNLGTVFQSLGEYVKAKEYYNKDLTIRKEIGQRGGEAAGYGNLGSVCISLGEYYKAKDYTKKALEITKEIGDKSGEATLYGNLGTIYLYLGKYMKAKECLYKALTINQEIGNRNKEATDCADLGSLFQSLGEYVNAKEYFEKSLAIRREVGDRKGESSSYENLGCVYQSLCKYEEAKEYHEKALALTKEIGDRNGEASSYGNIGSVFLSIGEYVKAKEYLEKALLIKKEIGDKDGEANAYGNLGAVFISLGSYVEAEKNLEKALAMSKEIGNAERQMECLSRLAWLRSSEERIQEALSYLLSSIRKCEELRGFLGPMDKFKISLLDINFTTYWNLSKLLCNAGNPNEALYVSELGRASALADLMSSQYSVVKKIWAHPQSWDGIEKIMKKESSCICLYISYSSDEVLLWVLTRSGVMHFRENEVNENTVHRGLVRDLDDFLAKSFRQFAILPKERCEDRSLHGSKPTPAKCQEDSQESFRLVEEEDQNRNPISSLSLCYKMVIAPVADLLEGPEIIIVPDRSLYKVPFAALPDERGKPLSETFRIRIVPSLTTLKLIQDSPTDYHSQTGALIVGDPDVGLVRYKGRKKNISRLPCAGNEAAMIGRLLGVQPLLGEQATKQAVLQNINSVSLIHFAAHGDGERGEIALSPSCSINRVPKEEDYLLTMSDVSQVQLRAKLVVLSCCHSGQGEIKVEGVVGIARAFLASGARSVLVALWALEDSATEQMMRSFYGHLVRGESASESLHEAMKWMRANGFNHVRQWAPFMLIGDNVTFNFGK